MIKKPQHLSLESYSLLLLLLSAVAYAIMACFVRLATDDGIPSYELVFIRAILQGSWVVLGMINLNNHQSYSLIRQPFGPSPKIQKLVVTRGMIGGIGFLFYYYTMSVLPLGDAVTLLSTSPILTIFAARLILKENLTRTHVLAAFASFFGAMLLARPTFFFPNTNDGTDVEGKAPSSVGYITAILGACCGSAVQILIRRLNGVHTLHLLFSWSVFGTLYSLLVILFFGWTRNRQDPSSSVMFFAVFDSPPSSKYYIGGLVLFGSLGHFLLNYAGRTAPAGLGSIVRSSGIMWSYFLQIAIFHLVPNKYKLLGVSLIVISLIMISSIAAAAENTRNNDNNETLQDGVHPNMDEEATTLVEKLPAANNQKTPTRMMTSLRYGSIDEVSTVGGPS